MTRHHENWAPVPRGLRLGALLLSGLVLGSFLVASPSQNLPAEASHLRGGLVTVEYHPATMDGHGTEEVHIVATMLATTANPDYFGNITVKRDNGSGSLVSVSGCSGLSASSNTADNTTNPNFSINTSVYTITGCFGTPGEYVFESTNGARIGGIANSSSSSSVQFEARISIDGTTETAAPTFAAGYMYNIAYSADLNYSTNLNALGQGNSPVTYSLITSNASTTGGYGASQIPCSDLNSTTGVFRINSSLCTGTDTISAKFGSNQIYALKVRATDANGQYATRDVLLQFGTTTNQAPVFASTTPSPGSLSVTPGSTQTIVVVATDPDGNTVDFTENVMPSWISESTVSTSGTGAATEYTKTYTLSPPLGTNEIVQFEISAFDNASFSLSRSIQYDVEAGGVLPPGAPGAPTLTPGPSSLQASFTAPTSGGTVSSYRADSTPTAGGATVQTTCATPPATSCNIAGLQPLTEYSVVIVATNSAGSLSSSASTATTLAAPAPTASTPERTNRRDVPPIVVPQSGTRGPQTQQVTEQPRQQSQGPILRGGNPPEPPFAPQALIDGRPTQVASTVTSTNQLDVRTGTLNLGVSIPENRGAVTRLDDGQTQIGVQKGSSVNLAGSGLRPGSTVQVFLPLSGDNSKELTQIPVGPDGTFSGPAPFATRPQDPPLPIGRNVLQLVSLDQDGNQIVVEMTVNIAQGTPAPELNRLAGDIPTMAPGQSIATSGGEPVPVTVTPVSQQKLAVIEGDGWNMAINVSADEGGVEPSEGGALLRLIRNEGALVSGSGFMPGTRADIWLFSEPTLLATVSIDENGEFSGEVNVDQNLIPIGEHTLQLQGVGEDGYVKAANLGVLVDDAATQSPADTATASLGLLWWILIALGVALALAVAWVLWSRGRATRLSA